MYYCTVCDYEQGDAESWGNREYVLENGVRIPVRSSIGWCESCNGIAAIEDLSLHTRMQAYRDAQSKFHWEINRSSSNWLFGLSKSEKRLRQMYEDFMSDAIDAIEMMSQRKSPIHCLKCSSTRVHVSESSEDNALLHYGCKGEIRRKANEGGLQIALRQSIQRYTSEGLFIEKEYLDNYSSPDRKYSDVLSESNRMLRELRLNKAAAKFDYSSLSNKQAN
jgi:hypothetical protein